MKLAKRSTVWAALALAAALGCDRAESAGEQPAASNAEDSSEPVRPKKAKAKAKTKNKSKAKAKGPKHTCNVCGSTAVFRDAPTRKSASCPICKCAERHRLFIYYLDHATDLLEQKLDVLHFSPQECEETALRHQPNWNYVTTDYMHEEDLRLDLTKTDQPDASWDLLILYHILEHIPDDIAAISEMYRILRPGGQAIIQVPIEIDQVEIYEDPTITDPKERSKHFGQADHVRKYSAKGLRERLEAAGFEVEVVDYLAQLDPAIVERHKLAAGFDPPQDEAIWIAKKPAAPAAIEADD